LLWLLLNVYEWHVKMNNYFIKDKLANVIGVRDEIRTTILISSLTFLLSKLNMAIFKHTFISKIAKYV